MHRRLLYAALAAFACSMAPGRAHANLFVNPGFESGLSGWIAFGNAFAEAANPPQFVPYEGNGLVSMFGNFSGGFNVTGIFQEFPAAPGEVFSMSSRSRHFSGDPMVGGGAAGGANWVVQKLAFKDAADVEIGSVESTILDGTFATDVWHDNAAIAGAGPAGTVQVEAFILYLQPQFDGGAAHVDNLVLIPEPASLGLMVLGALALLKRRR